MPAVAPLLGASLISVLDWRAIFIAFVLFVVVSTIWTGIRITEPLKPELRISFSLKTFWAALTEISSLGIVRTSIATLISSYGILFTTILLVQPIFDTFF